MGAHPGLPLQRARARILLLAGIGSAVEHAKGKSEKMNVDQLLRYLDQQQAAIQALVRQLDEIQVAFSGQFDHFQARHDAKLDRLSDKIVGRLDAAGPDLQAAIRTRATEETQRIDDRRQKIREQYLPQRQQAADQLLSQAQAELADLHALNPQLNAEEETLKRQQAQLEGRLAELNEAIRQQSRGLGVALRFTAITRADRERHRVLGKLDAVHESLYKVRQRWAETRSQIQKRQEEAQNRWQLESIAVGRLQAELDHLDDGERRGDLALRRAIHYVLDHLKQPASFSDAEIEAGLQEMVELNIQTDSYHEGLASVAGLIGLLGGIRSGLQALQQSVEGLKREQQMHREHLRPLSFSLPAGVEEFHRLWPVLAKRFADEVQISKRPADFAATVQPLLEGPLSKESIEAMFEALSTMIHRATARWP
jgi:hypothetical protein